MSAFPLYHDAVGDQKQLVNNWLLQWFTSWIQTHSICGLCCLPLLFCRTVMWPFVPWSLIWKIDYSCSTSSILHTAILFHRKPLSELLFFYFLFPQVVLQISSFIQKLFLHAHTSVMYFKPTHTTVLLQNSHKGFFFFFVLSAACLMVGETGRNITLPLILFFPPDG